MLQDDGFSAPGCASTSWASLHGFLQQEIRVVLRTRQVSLGTCHTAAARPAKGERRRSYRRAPEEPGCGRRKGPGWEGGGLWRPKDPTSSAHVTAFRRSSPPFLRAHVLWLESEYPAAPASLVRSPMGGRSRQSRKGGPGPLHVDLELSLEAGAGFPSTRTSNVTSSVAMSPPLVGRTASSVSPAPGPACRSRLPASPSSARGLPVPRRTGSRLQAPGSRREVCARKRKNGS